MRTDVPSPARRRGLRALILLAILALVAAISGTALAVHDEAFELDGNIDNANPVGGPEVDWDDDIVTTGANGFSAPKTSLPAGFSAATAGPDFTTTIKRGVEVAQTGDDTTFTTNSKDILDISAQWRCVHANNVTDKGDLVNTYAVAYVNSGGELILYFGAEKNDASGTNNLGVWFLQDETVNCSDTQGGSGTAFTGSHQDGDILVVSEFSNGGVNATITAYIWDPTNPAAVNNLVNLGSSGVCGAPGTDDRLCAITNVSNTFDPPWKTWDKDSGSLNFVDTQQFYEGGINVSAFGLNPCISTMLTDTRSSVSTTATLYDFARVPFNVCNSKSGTKFNDLNVNGVKDAGEPGLSGWTINLYQDTGTKGTLDGEGIFRTDETDSNGVYSFDNLLSGDYIVCEVPQATWTQSRPAAGQTLPSGETLVTNCPGPSNGYAFSMSGSDRTGNDFGNFQRGAFRIEKRSTKSGNPFVANSGAVFSYDGQTVTDNGAGDEDPMVGRVCVSGLLPGSYTVDEVSPPPGYGDSGDPPQSVTVVGGTNCSTNPPGAGATATFTNPPLYDLQVNFRDGGSGETSATINCGNLEPPNSTTPPTGWQTSKTYTGRAAPRMGANAVVCTIEVDP